MKKYTARELFVLDEFARAALPPLLTASLNNADASRWPEICDEISENSYILAEAMIKQRVKMSLWHSQREGE